jgi:hypothetical protein
MAAFGYPFGKWDSYLPARTQNRAKNEGFTTQGPDGPGRAAKTEI